ncbi:unnamed protein product (macronuclear) [Paramecium tetraurelia]|uniref:Mini antigen n=1 Tax=Paramecium tetraurelia TaxID=5888 RepID=A0EAV1_PARTE|nr:uncharacterized protein GSPATT00025152001 [Paramecium tetraurelia]CAK92418.1 unnamed protein product [Paramecium tetraurelia]|eukprot:XP_001459815.1 hypothetical protein (macronuclear) [Paramecium tetraurelia strain d4-2]
MAHSTLLILGMILVTLNGFSVDISGSDCSCDTFTTQLDCNAASACEWTNSECVDVDCSTKTTIVQCNVANSVCAFTPSSQCATFTSCSDYKYSDEATCLTIGCLADTKGSDGLYPCKAITSLKKCSEHTTETECTTHQCFWNSQAACVAPTCAQQTTALDCTAIRSDVVTTWQICSWTAGTSTCADATGLTQSNCAVLTRGSYYWNTDSSACEVCQGSSSYAQLITLGLALLMLII